MRRVFLLITIFLKLDSHRVSPCVEGHRGHVDVEDPRCRFHGGQTDRIFDKHDVQ